MIRAAFYAPMKPPSDPVPSGDREIARAILAALKDAGIEAAVVSEFRSRDGRGDPTFQQARIAEAAAEIPKLVARGRDERWQLWVSYHNYYKAPDLLGPAVSAALDLPYLQIESTRARKRLSGPWAAYAQAAEAASDRADAILHLTTRDAEALDAYRVGDQIIAPFAPFLARSDLPPESDRAGGVLSVGMMRKGDKLASYQLIAETLSLLPQDTWQLEIAGDGPARPEVEALMAPFGTRVTFLGALDEQGMQQAYGRNSVMFWPGVNEAFGMAYLEAQAAGLALVAQDRPGVEDVLFPGSFYPLPETGPSGLAVRLDFLLAMPKLTLHIGQAARAHIGAHHLLGSASARLKQIIAEVLA